MSCWWGEGEERRRGEPARIDLRRPGCPSHWAVTRHTLQAARGHCRTPAISFKSGAGERRWASGRTGSSHLYPLWPFLSRLIPSAGHFTACGRQESRRRSPHGDTGVQFARRASESTAASQPLAEVPAPLCPLPRAEPPSLECYQNETFAGGAPPKLSVSLAGACTSSQRVDAHQGRLIIVCTCDRSLGVAGTSEAEQQV
ncbi:hypothetical protein D623_10015169 [Myotis brandtii]|uniref:Uncharacterized protein n=1 Tax=Myotis brandtii TaxID=109478 RepID=S7Q496_MYOBR|nr:hypothetical protein D623_10015169 [Myotis brandtii]